MNMPIKEIDGVKIKPKHRASCHCGAVEIELYLSDGLSAMVRCNCSMCLRRGTIMGFVPLSSIKVVKGQNSLQLYQFHTKKARHYFCKNCGIYTHHQRRANPEQYAFNVSCLEGINPLAIEDIPVYDGMNHPADRVNTQ